MKKITFLVIVLLASSSNNQTNAQSLSLVPSEVSFDNTNKLSLNTSSSPRLFIHGLSSINTTQQIASSIQASQSLKFTARLKEQTTDEKGLDLTASFNILHLNPTGIQRDSFDITSLMFPESGNTGLMIAPAWHWHQTQDESANILHRFSSELSFSIRQNRIDGVIQKRLDGSSVSEAQNLKFTVININLMPINYGFNYLRDKDTKFNFNIGAYFNHFNVPNEDAKNFNKLFPLEDPLFNDKTSRIESIGFKFSVGLNGFLFFSDVRYNFNSNSFEDENPFKGTVFNAGIAQNISIFKL